MNIDTINADAPVEIIHPTASWCLRYEPGKAFGPESLESQGARLLGSVYCAIDGVRDYEALASGKVRHFHKGGIAVFEGEGTWGSGVAARLRQSQKVSANTCRMTYDLDWPKASSLKTGLEIGSVQLPGAWKRYFLVEPGISKILWHEIPENFKGETLSPIPAAIVLEDKDGRRVEWGLGDDLWRWAKGLNGEFLHATGRLVLSLGENGLSIRRFASFCDPEAEAKAAEALKASDPRFCAVDMSGIFGSESGEAPDGEPSAPKVKEVPVSQPDPRRYRFGAYFAWSDPMLASKEGIDGAAPVEIAPKAGVPRRTLEALGKTPRLEIDLATLPVESNARHTHGALPCWESRNTQGAYRRLIRQINDYSREGLLVLRNMTPSWCDVGSHVSRHGETPHWDLPAILETMAWTRQALAPGWRIAVSQEGVWSELPSLSALGAPSGFRNEDLPEK